MKIDVALFGAKGVHSHIVKMLKELVAFVQKVLDGVTQLGQNF